MKTIPASKQGAALLLILGILAILATLALLFAAQMRTERLANNNYLAKARTLHLLDTALARAAEDIDAHQTTYFSAFGSAPNQSTEPLSQTLAFDTERNQLPATGSLQATAFEKALQHAHWEPVSDASDTVIGRIGYVVVNCTGLLDANTVGGYDSHTAYAPRSTGTSPREIQLSRTLLPEINSSSKSSAFPHFSSATPEGSLYTNLENNDLSPGLAFIQNRSNAWHHFETLNELYALMQQGSPNILTKRPQTFSTYSLFPNNHQTLNKKPWVDLSDGTRVAPIAFQEALSSAGLAQEAKDIYLSYLDYCDPDNVPTNTLIPCTEKVPMFNEIWLSDLEHSADVDADTNLTIQVSGTLNIELWYPFTPPYPSLAQTIQTLYPANNDDLLSQFGINALFSDDSEPDSEGFITVFTQLDGDRTAYAFTPKLKESTLITNRNFYTAQYTFEGESTWQRFGISNGSVDTVAFGLSSIELAAQRSETLNALLDETEEIYFSISLTNENELIESATPTLACIDPRINHDANDPTYWEPCPTYTLNQFNRNINLSAFGEEANYSGLSTNTFFVRNGPMTNAAELGFLSIGAPWRTIRLYAADSPQYPLNPVLDYFHAGEPIKTNATAPGLININSRSPAAIATALVNCPIQQTPLQSPQARLSSADALILAENHTPLLPDDAPNQQRISQLGKAFDFSLIGKENEWSDAQKESLIANSYRLFGWRDNLYAIIVAAQSLKGVSAEEPILPEHIQSTQKAIIYLWRDPLTQKSAIVFYGRSDTLSSPEQQAQSMASLLEAFRPN